MDREEDRLLKEKRTNSNHAKDDAKSLGCQICSSAKGICLALMAGIFNAFNNSISAFLTTTGMSSFQILFVMYTGGLVLVTPLILCLYGVKSIAVDTWSQRILLVSVGVCYTLQDICQVFALSMIPVGNVTAIYRGVMPIVISILARIFLKEPFTKIHFVSTVLCLTGILLTSQPRVIFGDGNDITVGDKNSWLGYLLSVGCGFCLSITYILGSALGDAVPVLIINLYENSIGAIISGLLTFTLNCFLWKLSSVTYGLIIGLIVTFVLNFSCRFRSLQLEPPTTVVLLVNVQIFVAYLADYAVFNYTVNIYDTIGAVLITLSSAFVAIATTYLNVKGS
ncbi:solute carrier family 35 member G2-like [Ptychodera flava]|uniref:solute carrier family 35 member G2-like n=1 Tax=Ptychodera flava TaxID=63121 RepID=UPI00396A9209